MAKTQISDIIVPELFAPYIIQRTTADSKLVNSGITQSCALLDTLVAKGGKIINMPSFSELSGNDDVLSDSAPLVPVKVTAQNSIAPVLIRGKAWSANELAGALAGSDPMTAAGEMLSQWWNLQERRILISILSGISNTALKATHSNDISGATGSGGLISAPAILDTKQLLGDAAIKLTAIAMHSAVYTKLQKDNLIEYIPNSEGVVDFPLYLGYKVIIDDGFVPANNIYNTYLFAEGAFARGEGVPESLTPIETGRDILASDDILVSRRALCLHPIGLSWKKVATAGATANNSELSDGANWEKVAENKAIGIAMLKHRI